MAMTPEDEAEHAWERGIARNDLSGRRGFERLPGSGQALSFRVVRKAVGKRQCALPLWSCNAVALAGGLAAAAVTLVACVPVILDLTYAGLQH